ncbi:hypothetical protein DK37_17715 [Halomonas sp. SUBG004]|nr:hypothetical protein DK37_17715 [Halomonas sp. SUBG004]
MTLSKKFQSHKERIWKGFTRGIIDMSRWCIAFLAIPIKTVVKIVIYHRFGCLHHQRSCQAGVAVDDLRKVDVDD